MFWWWIRAIKLNGGSVQEVEIISICSPRIVRKGIGINSIKILFPINNLPSVRILIPSLGIICALEKMTWLVRDLQLFTYPFGSPHRHWLVPETLVGRIVRVLVAPLVFLAMLAGIVLPFVCDGRLAVVAVAGIATASSSVGFAAPA